MKKTNKGYSRREFLVKAVGGAAAAGLIGKAGLKLEGKPAGEAAIKNSPITRVLGKTGIRIPVVSMGVMNADNPAL